MVQCLMLGVIAAILPQTFGDSFSLPLAKKIIPGAWIPPIYSRRGKTQVGEFNDQGFWFANFTVGSAANLEMLIDTGSTDVYLNPGTYAPSSQSQNLHQNFSITFATTNPDGSGIETISGPVYKDIVALDSTQLSTLQLLGVVTDPVSPPTFPHNGLVGFAGIDSSALNSLSWFETLCTTAKNLLSQCRFGLAFNTDLTGVQYFGYVAYNRFFGPLSVAPLYDGEWSLHGDITANGKVIEKDAFIVTDSGTTIVFGPLASVQTLFDAAGIQSVVVPNTTADAPTTLTGYYSCSNPPKLGFGFPSASDTAAARANYSSPVSKFSTIFNILESQLAESKNGDNCTAVIHGTDQFDVWLVGQAFFQGRYIDHNVEEQTMGFANLIGVY